MTSNFKRLFHIGRVKLCRTPAGRVTGQSLIAFTAFSFALLGLSGCLGSGENGSIQFQTYADSPYYPGTPQTPGWIQSQLPGVVVGHSFTIQANIRDNVDDPYQLPVSVSLVIANSANSNVVFSKTNTTSNASVAFSVPAISSEGTYVVTMSSLGFQSFSQNIVVAGTPTRLVFLNSPAVNMSSCSPITVTLWDAANLRAIASSAISLSLTSTPTNDAIYYSEDTCTTVATTATIPAGGSSATFWVWDDSPEKFGLTVGATSPTMSGSVVVSTVSQNIYMLGGIVGGAASANVVLSSDGGTTWNNQEPSSDNPFPVNYGGSSVIFNNQIYYFGGKNGNAVYQSHDGVNWIPVATLPYTAYEGAVVVWNHKMWYLGGYSIINGTKTVANTVWSFDGVNPIVDYTTTSNFPAVAGEAAYALGTSMGTPQIVIAGGLSASNSTATNLIYTSTSTDLGSWTQSATINSALIVSGMTGGICEMGYALFDHAFYIFGGLQGQPSNGVVSSYVYSGTSGDASWSQGFEMSAGNSVDLASVVVHLDSGNNLAMSALGGQEVIDDSSVISNLVFNTSNGSTWTQATNSLPDATYVSTAVSFMPGR